MSTRTSSAGRWYALGQHRLYGLEAGGGPPVVLLHGITAHAYVWQPLIELLAPVLRVVAVDQRGHGRSDRPSNSTYSAEELGDDVGDLIEALDDGPAIVVGHSLGARNALVAADRHPDQVAGIVAIEWTPFIEDAVLDSLEERVSGGADQEFPDLASARSYLRGRYRRLPDDAIERRARYGYSQLDGGPFRPLADPDAMRRTCRGLRADIEPVVRRLRRPTILVRGEDSVLVSAQAFDRTRQLRPDLPAMVIEDTDHYVPEEKPARIAEIVRDFAGATYRSDAR